MVKTNLAIIVQDSNNLTSLVFRKFGSCENENKLLIGPKQFLFLSLKIGKEIIINMCEIVDLEFVVAMPIIIYFTKPRKSIGSDLNHDQKIVLVFEPSVIKDWTDTIMGSYSVSRRILTIIIIYLHCFHKIPQTFEY